MCINLRMTALPEWIADVVSAKAEPLLRVRELRKYYAPRGRWGRKRTIPAVDGVNFEISAGKTLALVGKSGSGKSTVARCVTRLERPDAGQVLLDKTNIAMLRPHELRPFRSEIQMVFQDPTTSMNSRFSAAEVVEEPMQIAGLESRHRRDRMRALMAEVGLSPEFAERLAYNFSGGQKQRLAIARALAVQPKLLVLDEALSGLDFSTQSQIANLLLDLQAAHRLTYLLISHDLALVAAMADAVAVMSEGRIAETGPTQQILSNPQHPVTKNLLMAANMSASKLRAALGVTS
jgi:ABC-type glutathione transport system ATPase component